MQQYASAYSAPINTIGPWGRVKGQNISISESSHVAYQIKRNGARSTMQAHILSLYTSSAPRVVSKDQNISF